MVLLVQIFNQLRKLSEALLAQAIFRRRAKMRFTSFQKEMKTHCTMLTMFCLSNLQMLRFPCTQFRTPTAFETGDVSSSGGEVAKTDSEGPCSDNLGLTEAGAADALAAGAGVAEVRCF